MDLKEKQQILEDYHCDATSGHMGIKKTLARITEWYIWAGVAKDVCSLVSNCKSNQKLKDVLLNCMYIYACMYIGTTM